MVPARHRLPRRPFVPVVALGHSGDRPNRSSGNRSGRTGMLGRRGDSRLASVAGTGIRAVAAGNLGVMAVPEAAVLITLATAWPRRRRPLQVNASMVAFSSPLRFRPGARFIADRVRAVGRSGFVAASRCVWCFPSVHVPPRRLAASHGGYRLDRGHRCCRASWPSRSAWHTWGWNTASFEGLGKLLAKSFSNLAVETALIQMLATISAVLWVALLPQIVLRLLGVNLLPEGRA